MANRLIKQRPIVGKIFGQSSEFTCWTTLFDVKYMYIKESGGLYNEKLPEKNC